MKNWKDFIFNASFGYEKLQFPTPSQTDLDILETFKQFNLEFFSQQYVVRADLMDKTEKVIFDYLKRVKKQK